MKTPNEQQRNLMHERGYMLATEAATISGWHLSWIHRQVQREKLRGEKVGATWYVNRVSLALALGRTIVTSSAPFLTSGELMEVEAVWAKGAASAEEVPARGDTRQGVQTPEQRPKAGGTGRRPSATKKAAARPAKGKAAREARGAAKHALDRLPTRRQVSR